MILKSEYRKTLGSFTTGVTIITTTFEGEHFGFTANSFTSVSLDPPIVLFCVKKDATFTEALANSKKFGVNILSEKQEDLSNRFANSDLVNSERFDGIKMTPSSLHCPILIGCLAFLDCEQIKMTQAGDHFIVMGKVINFDKYSKERPLIYFAGGYRSLTKI